MDSQHGEICSSDDEPWSCQHPSCCKSPSSALGTGPSSLKGMELCQGRAMWGLGTGPAPEGGGHGTGCPGQWHGRELPKIKECLKTALSHMVWVALCGARSWTPWSLQAPSNWDIPWLYNTNEQNPTAGSAASRGYPRRLRNGNRVGWSWARELLGESSHSKTKQKEGCILETILTSCKHFSMLPTSHPDHELTSLSQMVVVCPHAPICLHDAGSGTQKAAVMEIHASYTQLLQQEGYKSPCITYIISPLWETLPPGNFLHCTLYGWHWW